MKILVGIAIIVVLGAGVFYLTQKAPNGPNMPLLQNQAGESQNTSSGRTEGAGTSTGNIPDASNPGAAVESIKEFTVEGSSFSFSLSSMNVKKGDKVRIVFKNMGGTHDFRLDEFAVATKMLKGGEQETVEFTASKTGSFEYYCSVGSHRAMGMKGTLIVK